MKIFTEKKTTILFLDDNIYFQILRALLYEIVEEFLFKFGMDGKACLLRAICEMHESPLVGYGLFGEMLELFLT